MAKCNYGYDHDMPKGKGDGSQANVKGVKDITPGVSKNFGDYARKTEKQFDTPPMKKLPKSK